MSRRGLIARGGAVGLAALAAPSVVPRFAFAADGSHHGSDHHADGTVVVLFLRGAVDGLSVVVPHSSSAYHDARPTIAIPSHKVHDLDGHFGLHPSLGKLMPMWNRQELAIVHAAGLRSTANYSHFDAQAEMELGHGTTGPASGWLARHLQCRPHAQGTFRAISFGPHVSTSLVGWPQPTTMGSLDNFSLNTLGHSYDATMRALDRLFSDRGRPATEAAHATFAALRRVSEVRTRPYHPSHGAKYPTSQVGRTLLDIARVLKAVPQTEAVTADVYGWDTHAAQDAFLPGNLADFGASLAAFTADMGDRMRQTTIIVMSEFGRRLEENSAHGTDHGHGTVMFVIGKGIHGGRVFGHWPGLGASDLDDGNLAVTTDYRQVVSEVVHRRLHNHRVHKVFPGLHYRPIGLAR
jgi:uncharacterized protein (DUF1501 family)